jgi:hypothetical protein
MAVSSPNLDSAADGKKDEASDWTVRGLRKNKPRFPSPNRLAGIVSYGARLAACRTQTKPTYLVPESINPRCICVYPQALCRDNLGT